MIISILTQAAESISHPDNFSCESLATDCEGREVAVTSPEAERFGLIGSLLRAEVEIAGVLPNVGEAAANLVIDVACRLGLKPDDLTHTDAMRILDAAIERAWAETGPRKVVTS